MFQWVNLPHTKLTHALKIKLAAPAHILAFADSNNVLLAFYELLRLGMMRPVSTVVDNVIFTLLR
jgi:hypothetical protein